MLSSHLCRHLFRGEGPGRQKPGVARPSLPPLHFLVITERHMVLSSKSAGLGSARPLPPCSALFNVVHLQVSDGAERGQLARVTAPIANMCSRPPRPSEEDRDDQQPHIWMSQAHWHRQRTRRKHPHQSREVQADAHLGCFLSTE